MEKITGGFEDTKAKDTKADEEGEITYGGSEYKNLMGDSLLSD